MPPVEVITEEMRRKAPTKRIKFTANTCEGGVDYGPDYPQDTVEVPLYRANNYISAGRAVEAEAPAVSAPAAAETTPPAAPEEAAAQPEAPAAPRPRQRG